LAFVGGMGKIYSAHENAADDVSAGIVHNNISKGGALFAIDNRAAGKACGFYKKSFQNFLSRSSRCLPRSCRKVLEKQSEGVY